MHTFVTVEQTTLQQLQRKRLYPFLVDFGSKEMNKVLILSYNQAIKDSLQHLLSRITSLEIESYDGDNLLNDSHLKNSYDLIIIDLSEGKINTLYTLRKLRKTFQDIPILAMGDYNESEFSHVMLKAGASQYLSINTSGERIHQAVYDAFRPALSQGTVEK